MDVVTTTINGVVVDTGGGGGLSHRVRRERSFRAEMHAGGGGGGGGGSSSSGGSAGSGANYYGTTNGVSANSHCDTYKSLGDVFGTTEKTRQQQQQQQLLLVRQNATGGAALKSHGGQLKAARSVTSVNMPPPQQPLPPPQQSQPQPPGLENYKHAPVTRMQPQKMLSQHYQQHQGFGDPGLRASYNERLNRPSTHHYSQQPPQQSRLYQPHVGGGGRSRVGGVDVDHYRSDGSLDLDHEVEMVQEVMTNVMTTSEGSSYQQPPLFRREFGSHGSIDILGSAPGGGGGGCGSFDSVDGGVGCATKSEESSSVMSTGSQDDTSPKQKKKSSGNGGFFKDNKSQKSLFKKFRSSKDESLDGLVVSALPDRSAEDRHRRRFFSHYDVSSVCATLSANGLAARTLARRNTTTGASAASAALRNTAGADTDAGDNVSNELVLR